MRFDEMNREQLLAARADHQQRLESGDGTETYQALLESAVRTIDKLLAADEAA